MTGSMVKGAGYRVGVLAGGPSNEREISLRSGRAVHDSLIKEGVDAIFLDVSGNIYDIIRKNKIDVAFIALHGRFGEDGTIQTILDSFKIPYTGSGARASQIALDKIASKEVFIKEGIPTPRFLVFEKNKSNDRDALVKLGIPVVVKPQLEGSSIGLSVVREKGQMDAAVCEAFKYDPKILIEEYVEGRELTVGILNDEPLPVIEIVPKNKIYDYKAKYSDPETQYLVPAPIDKEKSEKAKELGRRAHLALGCESFSRVDIMMGIDGSLYVLEVNTIPGMTERSLLPKAAGAIGLDFGKLCVKLIEGAFRKQMKEIHGKTK